MDGEKNGKPYFLMDDLGGKPTILGNPHINNNNLCINKPTTKNWRHSNSFKWRGVS